MATLVDPTITHVWISDDPYFMLLKDIVEVERTSPQEFDIVLLNGSKHKVTFTTPELEQIAESKVARYISG